jgi:hypothetical protein
LFVDRRTTEVKPPGNGRVQRPGVPAGPAGSERDSHGVQGVAVHGPHLGGQQAPQV